MTIWDWLTNGWGLAYFVGFLTVLGIIRLLDRHDRRK